MLPKHEQDCPCPCCMHNKQSGRMQGVHVACIPLCTWGHVHLTSDAGRTSQCAAHQTPEAALSSMHGIPRATCAPLCTGSGEVTLEQFQSAILELQRGLSISQLAALEHALCQRFGVGSFARLGRGVTLLQAVAAMPGLQAAVGDGAGGRAERSKVTSFATLSAAVCAF